MSVHSRSPPEQALLAPGSLASRCNDCKAAFTSCFACDSTSAYQRLVSPNDQILPRIACGPKILEGVSPRFADGARSDEVTHPRQQVKPGGEATAPTLQSQAFILCEVQGDGTGDNLHSHRLPKPHGDNMQMGQHSAIGAFYSSSTFRACRALDPTWKLDAFPTVSMQGAILSSHAADGILANLAGLMQGRGSPLNLH